jgi:hypothetical protein
MHGVSLSSGACGVYGETTTGETPYPGGSLTAESQSWPPTGPVWRRAPPASCSFRTAGDPHRRVGSQVQDRDPDRVTASSMVTATVQQTGGYFVQAAVPAAGSFTIYINKAPVSPATVKVAYLVLN